MTDSLDTLTDDELEFLLQASESGATINALELEEARHGATMRGDIEQIGLTDILQTLALSKMEGVLRVCNPLESRHLYIADGYIRPIMPAATRRRRLLGRLVQAGCVEVQELRRAISERRLTPVALEDLLTEAALVRAQDVEDAANVIFDEELFSLFTWRRGTFELFRSEEAAAALGDDFGGAPEYEIHSLLLEVARRSDDWARILDTIGSLDEIPTRSSASPPSASCTPEQRAIWLSAGGQSTYRQLAEEAALDLFDFARAAASLYSAGEIRNVAESDFLDIAAALAEDGDDGRAAVTLQALLERSEDPTPSVTLRVAEVYDRIGMRSAVMERDSSGVFVGSSFLYATARDWARFGLLHLRDGRWPTPDGEVQVLPEGWSTYVSTPTPPAPQAQYGAHWWLNAEGERYPGAPTDLYECSGFEQQRVSVIPSKDLVVVRLGVTPSRPMWDQGGFVEEVVASLP